MKRMKQCLALLCLLALLAGLAGCGAAPVFFASEPDCFRLGIVRAPDSLNPLYAESDEAWELFLLCYDSLWRLDEYGEPQPCLVESWDQSSDGLVWTIRLRQDVFFNDPSQEDPQPLTARDVKFSYELFMRFSEHCKPYFDGIRSIECPDNYTVVIRTDYVKGDMCYIPAPILPRYRWSAYSDSPRSMDNSAMIGTGPFVYHAPELMEDEVQERWPLTANADYFAGASELEELEFVLTGTPAAGALMLMDGKLDGCMGMTNIETMSLEGRSDVTLIKSQGPGRGSYVLAMNMLSGALQDEAVREALLYALDRERIFSVALGSLGARGSGFADAGSRYYLNPGEGSLFDTVTTQNMLAAAGYSDYDGDGVLETKDNKLELSFDLYTRAGEEWSASAQAVFASALEGLGVDINWKTTDNDDMTEVCGKEGRWDMYIARRPGGLDPQYVASGFAGGKSETGWQSEEYDAVYARFLQAQDPAERQSLCWQLQQIVMAECPYVVLGYVCDVQGIRHEQWTGYEDILAAQGGLFGTGSARAYMQLHAWTESELEERNAASEEPVSAGEEAAE